MKRLIFLPEAIVWDWGLFEAAISGLYISSPQGDFSHCLVICLSDISMCLLVAFVLQVIATSIRISDSLGSFRFCVIGTVKCYGRSFVFSKFCFTEAEQVLLLKFGTIAQYCLKLCLSADQDATLRSLYIEPSTLEIYFSFNIHTKMSSA